jgi:hypothetical protein
MVLATQSILAHAPNALAQSATSALIVVSVLSMVMRGSGVVVNTVAVQPALSDSSPASQSPSAWMLEFQVLNRSNEKSSSFRSGLPHVAVHPLELHVQLAMSVSQVIDAEHH